ncbi:MAG TPA: rhodanese-like domain-containing protein [Gemmatimonadaceae bacterium]|nr:rhodanese-like domain-containing protein [Gemmatimonadaceae bacterium]
MPIKSGADLIGEAKARIKEVTPKEVMADTNPNLVLLDVRERSEWNLGHLLNAIHIPRGSMETKVEALIPRDKHVVIYCQSGNRSAFAADTLQQMGYEDVASMAYGIQGWANDGGEIDS